MTAAVKEIRASTWSGLATLDFFNPCEWCFLTGQSFLIFLLSGSAAVVQQWRGGVCRGDAIYGGGFSHRPADVGTSPEDDVSPPALDRYPHDLHSAYFVGVRVWVDDADERHFEGLDGIRVANPAG